MTEEQSTMLLEKWCERSCKEICSKKRPCDNCVVTFIKQTLDINNHQKAEIERLQKENMGLRINCNSMCSSMPNIAKAERVEAIKEFAERLKATYPDRKDPRFTLDDCYTFEIIDNLVKEMTEENPDE